MFGSPAGSAHLPLVRKACRTERTQKAEEVLLGPVPDAMVEQPSRPGEPKGELQLCMPGLQESIHSLWKLEPQVLQS